MKRGGSRISSTLELKWNIGIDVIERGKRRRHHYRTHNIVVNTGRQFICETITPQSLGPSSFVRHTDEVVRYIGFGIGGTRQSSSSAQESPYVDTYPDGYGGSNDQTDDDVTVANLERPVLINEDPLWLQEIATPGTFPEATSTRFIAIFSESDINFGSYSSVPLSEIGLYTSGADPALPNGAAGDYPGAGSYLVAYDTFDTIHKTGNYTIEVRWELRLG